jgi:hypothetical protein|tara:strand:+ start:119 stop:397 length:279 start_codon:yes stop_codon:yes gene_type:complete
MVFKRWNRSPSKKAPQRPWSNEEMKMIGWCLSKNIGVAISPDWKDELNRWQIEININGNIHIDPNRYIDSDVYNKVIEYYKYYYKPNTNDNG